MIRCRLTTILSFLSYSRTTWCISNFTAEKSLFYRPLWSSIHVYIGLAQYFSWFDFFFFLWGYSFILFDRSYISLLFFVHGDRAKWLLQRSIFSNHFTGIHMDRCKYMWAFILFFYRSLIYAFRFLMKFRAEVIIRLTREHLRGSLILFPDFWQRYLARIHF